MRPSNILLDAADIGRIFTRIAHEILEVHRGSENLALVGIHTRGVIMSRRLQTLIGSIEGSPVPSGEMDITLYRDDWTRIGPHPVVRATDIPFSVEGKRVVLVDDVLFTGRTTRAAMDALMDFGRPDRVELAVMVDRGHRELPIQADYVGKTVETRRSETVNVMFVELDGEDRALLTEEGP
jgi:pyrimidine operon attenuation protein/uracil phosphoribosyltransferase